jgi:hypothetical protein
LVKKSVSMTVIVPQHNKKKPFAIRKGPETILVRLLPAVIFCFSLFLLR